MTKRYALKGINDDRTECAICGKVELKRVMWLVELDADGNEIGDAFHCGTTCGANLMGAKISKVQMVVRNYKAELSARIAGLTETHPASKIYDECLDGLSALGLNYSQRKNHPLFAKAKAHRAQAQEWAQSQQILIEVA